MRAGGDGGLDAAGHAAVAARIDDALASAKDYQAQQEAEMAGGAGAKRTRILMLIQLVLLGLLSFAVLVVLLLLLLVTRPGFASL